MHYTEEYGGSTEITPTYTEVQEPQLVTRQTVASAKAYMVRLLQLGAMEGALGEMDINPLLKPMIEAMHHVLAGGRVEIKLLEAGEPQVVRELNRRLEQVTEETNTMNQQAGYVLLLNT
jgi:hypothetical protein